MGNTYILKDLGLKYTFFYYMTIYSDVYSADFIYRKGIVLSSFTVFSEYLISVSIFYMLVVGVILTRSVYGLMLQKAFSECISLILLMCCYLICNDDILGGATGISCFHENILNTTLVAHFKFLVFFFSALFLLLVSYSLKEQKLTSFEYLLIMLFSILGLILMCSCNDLLTAYLALELSSLAMYTLAAFKKAVIYSVDSGVKYFVTGALSSSFFLLGSSFLYSCSGTVRLSEIPEIFTAPVHIIPQQIDGSFKATWNNYDYYLLLWSALVGGQSLFSRIPIEYENPVLEMGYTFILFSLFVKLAAAPFHMWSLDVYEGSPTSSSFFFAAVTKLSVFVLLCHIGITVNRHSAVGWQFYNLIVGAISVFVGSLGGLRQRKLKTLLAYSSITNVGYALMLLGSNNTYFGTHALLFHLVVYTISVLCIWSGFLFLRLRTKKPSDKYSKELGHLSLIRKSNPALAFSLALTLFSLSGVPPTIGFLTKVSVFLSVLSIKTTELSLYCATFTIICSVVATFYYIRVVKVLYFEDVLVGRLYYPVHDSNTTIFSFLIFVLLLLFIDPSVLLMWCYSVVYIVDKHKFLHLFAWG